MLVVSWRAPVENDRLITRTAGGSPPTEFKLPRPPRLELEPAAVFPSSFRIAA